MQAPSEKSKAFGPAYQDKCAQAALAAGCKGNAMGLLYCLFMQRGLWDWSTGQTTRPISHKDLGAAMGGLSYNTVKEALRQLREARIIGYADDRGRGVKWSDGSGHANKYKLLLPTSDPTQKTTTPQGKKHPDPHPKNDHHYHTPYLHKGSKAAPSRREVDKPASQQPLSEKDRKFHELLRTNDYGTARRLLAQWEEERAPA